MIGRRGVVAGLAAAAGACATPPSPPDRARPLIIAHRGASGLRPEHTMAAYRLAIAQGADFIEPDLVMTKDAHLVCRHENEISGTTDVAARPEFAARKAVRTIDGERVEGWFAEDFTLAELKTLRCRERLADLRPANTAFDGQEEIPTFAEVAALAGAQSAASGRFIGVYPELKHPTYLAGIGLDPVPAMAAALKAAELDHADAAVFVQCFEVEPLRRLHGLTGARLIQLIAAEGAPADRVAAGDDWSYGDMQTDAGLAKLALFVSGIGPQKSLVVPRDGAGRSLPATDLVARAHAVGLKVHPWTFRNENQFLPAELRRGADPRAHGDAGGELAQFAALGVDGVFTDFPQTARAALDLRMDGR